jgi:putative transposase
MKRSRFIESQILAVLKQAQAGTPVPQLCHEHGISSATFCKWRSKFGGMGAPLMSQLKESPRDYGLTTMSAEHDAWRHRPDAEADACCIAPLLVSAENGG